MGLGQKVAMLGASVLLLSGPSTDEKASPRFQPIQPPVEVFAPTDLQLQLDKGGEVVTCRCRIELTATLRLSTDGVQLRGQDTTFVWNGPSGQPMLVVNGALFTSISNVSFVAGSGRPLAGVEFRNAPGGPVGHPTFGNRMTQVRIGVRGSQTLDYGILFTGDVNGDSNAFENIQVSGASKAGVALQNPQAVANDFDGLWVFDSGIGFQARGLDSTSKEYGPLKLIGRNWGFGNSSVVDIDVGPNAGVDVTGFYSEGARAFVKSSGGGVTVRHGYWQRGPNAAPLDQGTMVNENTGGYFSWLRLEDFNFTQSPGERIVGWPANQLFLSNVLGLEKR